MQSFFLSVSYICHRSNQSRVGNEKPPSCELVDHLPKKTMPAHPTIANLLRHAVAEENAGVVGHRAEKR